MAFDNPTRNRLQRLVSECRDLLTREFDAKLQELYGVYAGEGRVLDLQKLPHLDDEKLRVATLLRERIEHLASGGGGTPTAIGEAVKRVLREQAFTVLNRFAALRMAEERGIIVESVGGGLNSKGFKTFSEVAYSGLGTAYERYRVFQGCMFDEMAVDLGVLFDRQSPYGLLFPRENVLLELFERLNAPEVKPLWKEDETIGWIYQYFNDPAERKKMRDESAAPRNSRELAVRNQFFTPRYVVEFLTDNTLGRIWYEMTRGETQLKEQCRYLVRRPNEIFLKPGEAASDQVKPDDLSQEDLLKQPVHIPHRPIKDPRTILVLDPACGSMHFGLYAFDLFEVIYDEAWALEEELGPDALDRPEGLKSLHETYAGKDAFLKDVPRLIIEHNLHGIDIDPRCAQIAGLSLWLRAQKAWKDMGLKPAERPAIKRSNIVCAEPMPGERQLLREFVEREFQPTEQGVFLRLLEAIFDKMQLAGEAGSLLKIEEEIRGAIEEAKAAWQKLHTRPAELFATSELNAASRQPEFDAAADLRPITADFWETAEGRLLDALRHYAEQAENGGGFQRRLFAEDAARGFAFIDLCRRRYDVVLMNPPFGDVSEGSKSYIFELHSREKTEAGACFVTRMLGIINVSGTIGIISNRTFLFADSFQSWKEVHLRSLLLCADFGFGVLEAVVETAAFILSERAPSLSTFIALTNSPDKGRDLADAVAQFSNVATERPRLFVRDRTHLPILGNQWFFYWISESVLKAASCLAVSRTGLLARRGLQTCDNFRFLRLAWEVAVEPGVSTDWLRLSKGGDYQPFWSDLHIVAFWRDDGAETKALIETIYDSWSKQIPSVDLYGTPGLTYTERTTSSLSIRTLPSGCLFDKQGPFVGYKAFSENKRKLVLLLGISYTYHARALIESHVGLRDATVAGSTARHYMPAAILNLPLLTLPSEDEARIQQWVMESIAHHRRAGALNPVDSSHAALPNLGSHASIAMMQDSIGQQMAASLINLYSGLALAEVYVADALALSQERQGQLEEVFGPRLAIEAEATRESMSEEVTRLLALPEAELVEETLARVGFHSSVRKQTFVGNRKIELAALALKLPPSRILTAVQDFEWLLPASEVVQIVCDDCVGWAVGRWDIRYATGMKAAPELPDPFGQLPVCPPGMLQNAQGLPASPADVPADYPLRISWPGILVDDEQHREDIERRVREALAVCFSRIADAIANEACEILGVKSLRDYFRKPAGFFADHLKRYSKSRRQAPIYWPLSTASGSYTLWIYYHRLTDQTLFQCVNDFVKPKITEVDGDLSRLTAAGADKPGARAEIERLTILRAELVEFRDELLRVAQLPYKPNLNDGVLITASPLWKLFRLPKWQKDLKACWEALAGAEYEWAHLTYNIWPDRVKKVCKTDRSIAIAHGLEDLCEVKAPEKGAKKGKATKAQMDFEEAK